MSTDAIMGLGDDQLQSMWQVVFPEGFPTGGNTDAIGLRCDLTFQIPEEIVGTYDIHKNGIVITKTGAVTTTQKQFTLEWRISQDWDVVDSIEKWFKAVYDPITGTALPDSMTRANVVCQAMDPQHNVIKVIRFKGAKPISITFTNFDNSSAEPMRVTVQFIYIDLKFEKP